MLVRGVSGLVEGGEDIVLVDQSPPVACAHRGQGVVNDGADSVVCSRRAVGFRYQPQGGRRAPERGRRHVQGDHHGHRPQPASRWRRILLQFVGLRCLSEPWEQ